MAHPAARAGRLERSVGWRDARMERPIAAAGLQLFGHSHGHEPAAAVEDGAPRADARSPGHAPRAHPRPRRIVVAASRGVWAAGDGALGVDAHAVAGVPGGCDPAVGHLPLGLRALRGLRDDARRCYAPDQHGARQSQDGVLGLHRLRVPAVHVAHLDLSDLQREERRRAVPARDPQHPVHLGEHFRPADVEPDDGPRARGGAARRHEVGEDLAVFHGAAGPGVPGRAGDRVHRVRPQGPDDEHQPVRLHLLRADRDARRARRGGGAVAPHLVGTGLARQARARQRDDGRDHGTVLAFRGCGVDRNLHRGLPHSIDAQATDAQGRTDAQMTERSGGATMQDRASVERPVHPTADVYLRVGAVLVILTVLEVGVFYVPAFHPVLVPVLLVLSAAKFTLVVMFYMHLKADSKFFTFLFGVPLLLAVGVMVTLLFLFFGALTLRGAAGAG